MDGLISRDDQLVYTKEAMVEDVFLDDSERKLYGDSSYISHNHCNHIVIIDMHKEIFYYQLI